MGIPKFAYFISTRYPLIRKKIRDISDVPEVDNLYFDINGIIHNVSQKYFCDSSQINETTKKIYLDVCEMVKKIVHLIKPKELLMIAVDGVAPRAKMNQQRIRRFRKELETNKLLEEENAQNQNKQNENIIFDSNAISAGTKFMYNLTIFMKEYILNEKKINPEWSKIEIILSGSDVPGEGEHKILEYLRTYKMSKNYNQYTRHCIYGLDADLIMLSLISHEANIIILREDTQKKSKIEKLEKKGIEIIGKNNNNQINYEFFLISVLREYLELEFNYLQKKINFNYNFERIIDDFVFLCFFVGNDFVPNLFSFNIENGALTHLYEFYKACLPELDGYITDKGKINNFRMKKFFGYLSKQELHSIDMMIRKNRNENRKNRTQKTNESKEQIKILMKQKKEEKKKKLVEEMKLKTKEEQINFKKNKKNKIILNIKKQFKEIADELKQNLDLKEEYNKYINKNEKENEKVPYEISPKIEKLFSESKKYEKYILDENYCSDFKEEDINDSDISDIDIKEVMNEIVKNLESEESKNQDDIEENDDINRIFIEKINKMKNAKEVKEYYYKEKLNIDINTVEGKKQRDKMFQFYIEGLQWILYYYYRGLKSWKWYYPYHYAPMISDFHEIKLNNLFGIFNLFDKDTSQPFDPYQSLLLILPKKSFNLLPNCYKEIPNAIPDYFPEKIEIDFNGKTAAYESLLLLPFIDEKKILDLEKKYRNLSPEEEKENNWGKSFLFGKNELQIDANYDIFEIYQNKNNTNLIKYDLKKCNFSFPTLKTIDHEYSLINVKQYFGRTSNMTKQILIFPKVKEKINDKKINKYLNEKDIFIDYPCKQLAKIKGFIYGKLYYYLYNGQLYFDNKYKLTKEVIESIRYSYEKKGIELEHPEILCDVCKFIGFGNIKGKMRRKFDEFNSYYVPFEITSLNAITKDFEKYISHFDYEYQENLNNKK